MNKEFEGRSFPPRVACQAINLPAGTLATWASRGYLGGFDAQSQGPGKARQFTAVDVLALGLIKLASDYSLELAGLPAAAPRLARQCFESSSPELVLIARHSAGQEGFDFQIEASRDRVASALDAGLLVSLGVTPLFTSVTTFLRSHAERPGGGDV